jgi:Co/Zn/Cd efflux system component
MSAGCCPDGYEKPVFDKKYRAVLWIALSVNAVMFAGELIAGLAAGSASLQADSLDFLSDAANYAISLSVAGLALVWRSRAALMKGMSMGVLALWVAGNTIWHAVTNTLPEAGVMGAVGILALLANGGVAIMLFAYRDGDANMRSVWICSRNDAIGNIAVLLAALGVFGTSHGWPDITVAAIMATLGLWGAAQVIMHARDELRNGLQKKDKK